MAAPIVTLSSLVAGQDVQFPLSASASVTLRGDRYLHAWLSHQFSGETGSQLQLVARARQFSSMVVLVGRIASASVFEPTYAAIVQNKDELTIPLDVSTIPAPKEFKDAIESLSPEQQGFAKAFRSMQLASTLFGILVIQIRPQLERVLNLPADALTKEIKLTQDLMQLFLKYQIPTDLLSYDAANEGSQRQQGQEATKPIEVVRRNVGEMKAMVQTEKDKELAEIKAKEEYERRRRAEEEAAVQRLQRDLELEELTRASERMEEMAMTMNAELEVQCEVMCSAPMRKSGGGFLSKMAKGASNLMRSRGAASYSASPEAMDCDGGAMDEGFDSFTAPAQAAPEIAVGDCPPTAAEAPPEAGGPEGGAQQPEEQQRQQQQQQQGSPEAPQSAEARDLTKVPTELEARFETFDQDAALRPAIISPGDRWTKRAQKALLAAPTESSLDSSAQKVEKDSAFDLLDALTKSGALPVEHASLHVVVAATHCFDKTVTETAIQDNVNPIEQVERSTLIMATTVHQAPVATLVDSVNLPRIAAASPELCKANIGN